MKHILAFVVALALSAPLIAQEKANVTFVSAKQLDAAARSKAALLRAGLWYRIFNGNPQYSTGVVRRTVPSFAEMHTRWTDVWYVIRGNGTLVTGGSMKNQKKVSPGEFRSDGISGGVRRHIVPGDVITVPAGTPHWVSKIEGKEIVYLMVKIASPAAGS